SWSKVLLAQVLFKSEKGKEGAETLKQALRENRSPAIRDWGLNSLMNSAYSLEGKGQYREAIKILEGVDFSGPKSYPLLRAMLQLARCYCLNSEYAKSEPILKQVMGSASEKHIQDIENMVSSARQMQASVERMKTMK
ncbi:MAG: tetratricopeptide repeat protein, partial [Chloroflexi bacterium]|nr:tetratricopeptide repeat protein [Chloroflexota bacterium]